MGSKGVCSASRTSSNHSSVSRLQWPPPSRMVSRAAVGRIRAAGVAPPATSHRHAKVPASCSQGATAGTRGAPSVGRRARLRFALFTGISFPSRLSSDGFLYCRHPGPGDGRARHGASGRVFSFRLARVDVQDGSKHLVAAGRVCARIHRDQRPFDAHQGQTGDAACRLANR